MDIVVRLSYDAIAEMFLGDFGVDLDFLVIELDPRLHWPPRVVDSRSDGKDVILVGGLWLAEEVRRFLGLSVEVFIELQIVVGDAFVRHFVGLNGVTFDEPRPLDPVFISDLLRTLEDVKRDY